MSADVEALRRLYRETVDRRHRELLRAECEKRQAEDPLFDTLGRAHRAFVESSLVEAEGEGLRAVYVEARKAAAREYLDAHGPGIDELTARLKSAEAQRDKAQQTALRNKGYAWHHYHEQRDRAEAAKAVLRALVETMPACRSRLCALPATRLVGGLNVYCDAHGANGNPLPGAEAIRSAVALLESTPASGGPTDPAREALRRLHDAAEAALMTRGGPGEDEAAADLRGALAEAYPLTREAKP